MTCFWVLVSCVLLAVSSASAQLTVISPNGGEMYAIGDTIMATWGGVDSEAPIRLEVSFNDGQQWEVVEDSADGLAARIIAPLHQAKVLLRISEIGKPENSDVSDSAWYVRRPTASKYPLMSVGSIVVGGYKDTTITGGIVNGGPVPMYLFASLDDTTNFRLLEPEREIVVPIGESPSFKIRFRPTDSGKLVTHITFTMRRTAAWPGLDITGFAALPASSYIRLTAPSGGRAYYALDTMEVKWEGVDASTPVRIEARPDTSVEYFTVGEDIVGGVYRWVVPENRQGKYWLRIHNLSVAGQLDSLPDPILFARPRVQLMNLIDFGRVRIDSTKTIASTEYILNMLGLPAEVLSAELIGLQANEFKITPDVEGITLASHEGVQANIAFTPRSVGKREAQFRIVVKRGDTVHGVLRGEGVIPSAVEAVTSEGLRQGIVLRQYPNPVRGITTIEINLDKGGHTRVYLNDLMGREIAVLVDKAMSQGISQLGFDTGDIATGVYYLVLEALNRREAVRIVVE